MAKQKNNLKRDPKSKFSIPLSLDDIGKTVCGWRHDEIIKTELSDFDPEELKELANAIFEYMKQKEIKKFKIEDSHLFSQLLKRFYIPFMLKKITGEDTVYSELLRIIRHESRASIQKLPKNLIFPDHLKERIRYEWWSPSFQFLIYKGVMPLKEKDELMQLSKAKSYRNAIEELFKKSQLFKKIESKDLFDITPKEVIETIARERGIKIDVKSFEKKDLIDQIESIVNSIIKKHEKNKWLILIEGIIIGLIANGFFELLKHTLGTLIGRAVQPFMQLNETEFDMTNNTCTSYIETPQGKQEFKTDVSEFFISVIRSKEKGASFGEKEIQIACIYVFHAICFLSIIGDSIPHNPLIKKIHLFKS